MMCERSDRLFVFPNGDQFCPEIRKSVQQKELVRSVAEASVTISNAHVGYVRSQTVEAGYIEGLIRSFISNSRSLRGI